MFFKRRENRREQLKNLGSAWAYFLPTLAKPQHERPAGGVDAKLGREAAGLCTRTTAELGEAATMLFLWALVFILVLQEQDLLGK